MTFQPVTPFSGIAGWRFLERTQESQQAAFDKSPGLDREVQYFKDNIAEITTAEELVADRQLLKVALGAFGLDEQIDSQFFMKKILEEGTDDPKSLANRLVDPRFSEFADAFGFGNILGARTGQSDFAQSVTDAYKIRQFEVAVGESDDSLRLAMTFKRAIGDYANSDSADSGAWFSIMGNPPLRAVIETAFNLPGAFGQLDIDRQREVLRDETRAVFGDDSVAVFKDPDAVNVMIDRYLARAQISNGPQAGTPGMAALSLLQSASSFSAAGRINLILSNS